MLISKFDLYKPEWLELVFDDRNKEYGAYDLRKHYSRNLLMAMSIAFFGVTVLFVGHGILFKHAPTDVYRIVPDIPIIPPATIKPHEIIPPRVEPARPHTTVSTVKYPILKITPDKEAENPPKITELQTTAIGSQTVKGKPGDDVVDIPDGPGTGTIQKVTEDNTPKDMYSVEVLPEPVGGSAAWAKFLRKNIHYPAIASEEGKQGKVFLSFIVEKDGHISNVVVERGAGYGLDEEAARVLRMAPKWKPGIQNGQPVRVKFSMPITFVIPDEDK